MSTESFLVFTRMDPFDIATKVDRVPAVKTKKGGSRPAGSMQLLSQADRVIGIDAWGRYTFVWKDRTGGDFMKRLVQQSGRGTMIRGGTRYDTEAFDT